MSDTPLLHKARQIALAAREKGGRALLVGGFVRDELLGLDPKDADIEVYGIQPDVLREMLRRFGKVDCVGESFRVYKLTWRDRATGERFELDVSLPRRDKKIGAGHKGFEVEGDPFATIEDAARRRDFTVNAILKDPLTNELLDPFGGREDLQNRVLRMVDAAHFGEDSLRVLRAMQFSARFEMTIDPATVELCRTIDLSDLPKERIWGEWEKLLLKAEKPSIGLKAARELGVLKLLPDLQRDLKSNHFHVEQNTIRLLDGAARERESLDYPRQVTLMLAALVRYLKAGYWLHIFDAFNLKTLSGYDVRTNGYELLSCAEQPRIMLVGGQKEPDGPIIRWFSDERNTVTVRRLSVRCELKLLYHLTRASGLEVAAEYLKQRAEAAGVWNGPPAPLLMGRHLLEMGLKPGPRIGEITKAVYEMQLDGDVTTLEEAQAAARRLLEEN